MNALPARSRIDDRLVDLVERYTESGLSELEMKELEDRILRDPDAQAYFVGHLTILSSLQWEMRRGVMDAAPVESLLSGTRHGKRSTFFTKTKLAALAAITLFMVTVATLTLRRPAPVERPVAIPTEEAPQQEPLIRSREIVVAKLADVGDQVVIGRNGLKHPAVAGMKLLARDSLQVPYGGTALLTLSNEASIQLGPQSILTFEHEGRPELREGYAEVNSSSEFDSLSWSIRTSTADTEIRSGHIALGASATQTRVRVASGTVQVMRRRDGAMADVSEGYCSTIDTGDSINPIPSRYGTALLIVSKSQHELPGWAAFNNLVSNRLIGEQLWRSALSVKVRTYEEVTPEDVQECVVAVVSLFPFEVNAEEHLRRCGLPDAAVPVICLEVGGFPVFGMTGNEHGKDYEFVNGEFGIDIARPGHPLAAGFHGQNLGVFTENNTLVLGWANPVNTARGIAHLSGLSDKWVLFGFEKGDKMLNGVAPERRVGLIISPDGIREGSPVLKFIDAAVQWCVETAPRTL
ncbi:FecR domain-containing protein [Planctomicrobium sp. SH661]|uniref:FecR domain-containing protein n=1 Tax=Planctomicrobium sp. SH661 TaxID=3448124 RepID=UPI003F5BC725